MLNLKNHLNQIVGFIKDKEDVILVDFPVHYNVGDLLIFLGELQYLSSHNIKLRYCLGTNNSDINFLKKVITEKTTILCHGGGNFGDLYPVHQTLREKIVQNFPNNRIILLPQTAYFQSEQELQRSRDIFKQHSDVVLFARDESTLAMFQDFTDQAYLMPDMAHALYGTLRKVNEPTKQKLYFLRKDIEKDATQAMVEEQVGDFDCFDWEDLITDKDHRFLFYINKLVQFNNRYLQNGIVNRLISRLWIRHTKYLVNKFSQLFSNYETIITSRLHGHILSCLVDVHSVILDNSYGKNSSYYHLWTKDLPIAQLDVKE